MRPMSAKRPEGGSDRKAAHDRHWPPGPRPTRGWRCRAGGILPVAGAAGAQPFRFAL